MILLSIDPPRGMCVRFRDVAHVPRGTFNYAVILSSEVDASPMPAEHFFNKLADLRERLILPVPECIVFIQQSWEKELKYVRKL